MDWLNPMNQIKIMQAVKSRQKTVTLLDGREFDLDYAVEPTIDALGKKHSNVFFKPSTGSVDQALVPRGYLSVEKVLALEFP